MTKIISPCTSASVIAKLLLKKSNNTYLFALLTFVKHKRILHKKRWMIELKIQITDALTSASTTRWIHWRSVIDVLGGSSIDSVTRKRTILR